MIQKYLIVGGTRIRLKDIGGITDPNGRLFEVSDTVDFGEDKSADCWQ